MIPISDPTLLLQEAKDLAESGEYDAAIAKLRESLAGLNQAGDYMGAADVHLLIADFEKLKAKNNPSPEEPEEEIAPVVPVPVQKSVPAKKTAPGPARPETPATRPQKQSVSLKDETDQAWAEGQKLLARGDSFQSLQHFLKVQRNLVKLGADPQTKKRLEFDIARAKELSGGPTAKATSSFDSTEVKKAMKAASTLKQKTNASNSCDLSTVFNQAMENKKMGKYQEALADFQQCLDVAVGPERLEIQKQIKSLAKLGALKERMDFSSGGTKGFVSVGQNLGVSQDNGVAARPSERAPVGTVVDQSANWEEREKVKKRKEAEQLVVEAENMENENVTEAIEKLKDAVHLMLVTGERPDRVEWIYDKLNQIKARASQQKTGLFEIERFDPVLLREYAFQSIDNAKDKIRYGKYKDAIEMYRRSVKALTKAGWVKDDVNYIIMDMVEVRKKQDQVERDDERLQGLVEAEILYMTENMEAWREGEEMGEAPDVAFDEDIHRPGEEKTVQQKHLEEMVKVEEERARLKEDMFQLLDEGRHLTELGKFKAAIEYYNKSLNIMEKLGSWENQKYIVTGEIENLKQLQKRQEEVLQMQKSYSAASKIEQKADLEEKFFLIKKAALLNQDDLKEKLLAKRVNDEKEKAVFEILIPVANKLKDEGKFQDALVEFKEALKMLTEAGWTADTQSLQDEIASLEQLVKKGATESKSASERRKIRDKVLEEMIPLARQAMLHGDLEESKTLYEQAVSQLQSIGWNDYVNPILDDIAEIDAKIKERDEKGVTTQELEENPDTIIDLGMRFLSKDMRQYALVEFKKALDLLERSGELTKYDELKRQIKSIELELKLDESKKILKDKKVK